MPSSRLRSSLGTSLAIVVVSLVLLSMIGFFAPAQASVHPSSHPAIFTGAYTSTNWSGYAITGPSGSVTDVKGSWVVPRVVCNSTETYSSFWVGIDGFSSTTVEQTGTDSDCQGGTPTYYAWYEFYPNPAFVTSLTIKPGDHMYAKVVYANSKFTITITDKTTGKTATHTQAVSGATRSSAEWIAEAPYNGGILPLADFGTVLYGDDNTGITSTCTAKDGSHHGPIGTFPSASIEEITMEKSSIKEAVPTKLSSDGTSFSVNWDAP